MRRYLSIDETKYLLSSVIDTWDCGDKIKKEELIQII
jgi:hypothetical protein